MTDETVARTSTKVVPHWLRVFWLRAIFWPFCEVRGRVQRACAVQRRDHYIVTLKELLAVTERLDEHPEGWDFPCHCAECRSYCDG
jgi:hypothetical protein